MLILYQYSPSKIDQFGSFSFYLYEEESLTLFQERNGTFTKSWRFE